MQRSHRGRWWYNPMGQAKAPSIWERIGAFLDDLFSPLTLPEGRKRIDPAEAYGHWAKGWEAPAMPKEKAG